MPDLGGRTRTEYVHPAGRTVAIIGASADRRTFRNKAVPAHLAAGFLVYPLHARRGRGVRWFSTVAASYADQLSRFTFYVHPTIAMTLLDRLAVKSLDVLLLNLA